MAQNQLMQSFEVRNSDVCIKFNCPNHKKRIHECIQNLQIDLDNEESLTKKEAFFGSSCLDAQFRFGLWSDKEDGWINANEEKKEEAFFFENTDYPVRIIPNHSAAKVSLLRLVVGKEENLNVAAEDDIIFGTINFRNQVGRTDFKVVYLLDGIEKILSFSTEVLSYKMDYRTDMRQVIADIEEEFSMLSYSLLKETYLTFKQSNTESTNLIWWQIFRDCYDKIVESVDFIINRPKRRLKSEVRYERAECMSFISPELENEYAEFENDPSHLYRIEEMFLSKDTVENRFLKYAIQSTLSRFKIVQKNILSIIKADNIGLRQQIQDMNSELDRLSYHSFFRGIGNFKGFTQDSLVMKQAHGYKEVYESWILLQCGYDLQDGIMQLEVKDISQLYEIWCFIKIKNIVNHILGEKAELRTSGNQTEGRFIKNLIQGKASDVSFIDKNNVEVVLASVMYNATSDDEAIDEFDPTKQKTDIIGTTSKTTEQRPDIVLRLSKSKDTIQYTYLFDAKYRLNDTQIFDCDVPPVDAINQLHRYRDAIYYTQSDDQKLKKEVVGGFVLYPGNLTKDQFNHSYYKKSIDEVNIGAYPLKPGNHWNSPDSELLLSIDSSEDVLYNTIKNWLNEESPRQELLENTIPQRGLEYTMAVGNGAYLLSTIDSHVNEDVKAIESGNSEMFVTGYSAILAGLDFQKIKFFAPVVNHMVAGYYIVSSVNAVDMKPVLDKDYNERVQNGKDVKRYKGFDKTIRIRLELSSYKKLEKPFIYGLDSNAAKGVALTRSEFNDYVKNKSVDPIDKV